LEKKFFLPQLFHSPARKENLKLEPPKPANLLYKKIFSPFINRKNAGALWLLKSGDINWIFPGSGLTQIRNILPLISGRRNF